MDIDELFAALGIAKPTDEMKTAVGTYATTQSKGLKDNNRELLATINSQKTKLKAFEGLDAEALSEALAELSLDPGDIIDTLKSKPATDAELRQRAEQAAEAKYARKIKLSDEKIAAAEAKTAAADRRWVDAEVAKQLREEITKKQGNPDLLIPAMKERVKASLREDGTVAVVVLGVNGEPMTGAGGVDGTMSDLVESFKRHDSFGQAFTVAGGGSQSTGGARRPGAAGTNPYSKKNGTFNITEQGKLRASNPTLADQLQAEAAREGNARA